METTTKLYNAISEAYKYFNQEFFSNQLPEVVLTLQKRSNYYGYFCFKGYFSRDGKRMADEIALNPNTFQELEDIEILAVLAHEMVHCWQLHFGNPSRRNYHNKEFAMKMNQIGLHSETGQKISHSIIEGGDFERVANDLIKNKGFKIPWEAWKEDNGSRSKKIDRSKVAFVCGCRPVKVVYGKLFSITVCPYCCQPFTWAHKKDVAIWLADNSHDEELMNDLEIYKSDLEDLQSALEEGNFPQL